ncbi:MAG: hypothetical protein ABJD97_20400 [Betaproteobacteria bacterium]
MAVEVRGRALRSLGLGLAAWLVAGACSAATARPVSTDDKIARLCTDLGTATFGGHLDRAVELTFPRLVQLAGRDQVLASLEASAQGSDDFRTLGISCEQPTQHSAAGGLDFALVPTLARSRTKDGLVYMPQHYLAISPDHGATWTFLFLSPGVTVDKLRPLLPDGIGDMRLPTAQQPLLIPTRPASAASAP